VKKDTSAFVNQLLVWLLVTIGLGGSAGLVTVWMRQQISVTAKANRDLAAQIARYDRLIDETRTQIETEQASDKLRHLNAALGLGLVPMNQIPVVHVTDNVVERLARRANAGVLADGAAPAAALRVSLPGF
jgi:hypothetical protein